jgi:ribosomal protein S13
MPNKKHPGFKKVQNSIAEKEGVGKKAAGAILASATRKSSKAAKKRNPSLKKVK